METIASRIYKPAEFSAGQVHEMLVTLGRKGFSPEMAAEIANTKSGKAEQIVRLFQCVPTIQNLVGDHQIFYHQFFNLDLDFSGIRIPNHQPGFDRLIIVAQGLTAQQVYDVCSQHFKCWKYTDKSLDEAVPTHDRDSKDGHYAIWVRNRVEADEELKNLSADEIKEKKLTTETLPERLLHELKFWSETKNHLDRDNTTLCSGSRDQDGSVPHARWCRDQFRVDWCYSDSSSSDLRSRQAVS
mgnify:CR=1 FL=1